MRRRRAVITGLGIVAPNGIGKNPFWTSLCAGTSSVDYITSFDPSPYPCKVAAQIHDFRPEDFMLLKRTRHRGRFSQLAVAAAKLAVEDSGLALTPEHSERLMACIGTSMNGIGDVYEAARAGYEKFSFRGIPPMSALEYAPHAPVSHVSAELGIRGQATTLASACTTGLDAIEWARNNILEGRTDVAIAGSTDAPISEFAFAALSALGVLSTFNDPATRASRPYDLRREGLVLGEGAAVFIIEELQHALSRETEIYAEVLGFGSGNEAGHGARIDTAELALTDALRSALLDASLTSKDVDYISSHGNALPDYDLVETRAFKRVLQSAAYNIPVSSIKSMIGHALGAASSLQVAAACMALQTGILPPTINLDTHDPECDLDYVPNRRRMARVRNILINAHAMGGTHSVLIIGGARP